MFSEKVLLFGLFEFSDMFTSWKSAENVLLSISCVLCTIHSVCKYRTGRVNIKVIPVYFFLYTICSSFSYYRCSVAIAFVSSIHPTHSTLIFWIRTKAFTAFVLLYNTSFYSENNYMNTAIPLNAHFIL